MKGDFVATALVQPDFSSQWNAVALMVHIDDKNWIKFAFENSDATGPSIVSVVTKEVSDDANGMVISQDRSHQLQQNDQSDQNLNLGKNQDSCGRPG